MNKNNKIGGEALKKKAWSSGKIDEHYNKTDKALEPKNTEVRRVAKMTRKSLAYALEGQPVKIKMALDILFDEDPRAYIDAIAKLMNYAMPKLSATEIKKDTDTKIEINLNEGATLDDIKKQIRGLEDAEDIDYTELDE
jgi:ribosomal protein S6